MSEKNAGAPSTYDLIAHSVTEDVSRFPRTLTRHIAESFGVSRVTANKYIQRLEGEGRIARSGPSTHPVFSAGYNRQVAKSMPIEGLDEQTPWDVAFAPYFVLAPNVRNIALHGFTEMLNNAIDHSEGTRVFVWMRQDERTLRILVSDDGVGIFEKIAVAMNLVDRRQALFELSKGKFTTDPSRHSGEGVFFTSRMFDSFAIEANGLTFSHDDQRSPADRFEERKGMFPTGTSVSMSLALDSSRTTSGVFEDYMNKPDDFGFTKTVVPMKLASLGGESLISRSQAKRLIARFDKFKVVILDFSGVAEVGQAFADELFRVYARQHPEVEITASHMTEQVERMYLRAINAGREA